MRVGEPSESGWFTERRSQQMKKEESALQPSLFPASYAPCCRIDRVMHNGFKLAARGQDPDGYSPRA